MFILKRFISVILIICVLLALSGCGKKKKAEPEPQAPVSTAADTNTDEKIDPVITIKMTPDNFYDYFEYHEYHSPSKADDGTVTLMQILYGFKLKDGYKAVEDSSYLNDLLVNFTATGIVNEGHYTIDYSTLEYTGETTSTQTEEISEDLIFWPKGDRTEIWAFGTYSKTFVIYLTDFTVTGVSGHISIENPLLTQPDSAA